MAGMNAVELWSSYTEAESHHSKLFAEQRSNVLLVAGTHYATQGDKFSRALRDLEAVTKSQKIRLTKNHTQVITKRYRNNILHYAPTVGVFPRNDKEYADEKVAEMHQSVWADLQERHCFPKKVRSWAQDFVDVGECIAKVFFDENMGHFLGYDPLFDLDETTGIEQPRLDENGQQVYSEPVHTGDVVFERILPFNLLSDPDARSWEECRWVIYRKMVPIKELTAMFKDDHEISASIVKSAEETYKIFDSATGSYRISDELCMVTEHYYRPCSDYPMGWYYFAVQGAILFEGELPLGIFPIVYAGFDEAATSARSYSIIKQLRPYQAEVNRCASKMAEHQITLGDDKVLLSNGATISPGGTAHGIKAVHVTGADPKVFAGRTGEQYVNYMTAQIAEMYQVANMREDEREDTSGQLDPYALLYKTATQKKPFVIYIQKFVEFLSEICKLALRYAKEFYTDEMLIPIVGKREYVNIAEFRNAEDLGYQIKVEETSEDLESRMGQQLTMNHMIQFAGSQLSPSDLGKMARSMPWGNKERVFEDLTQDYDNWVNDRLAMDRGEPVPPIEGENHPYIIKKIQGRLKERDFRILPAPVQQAWQQKLQLHQQIAAQQVQEAQRLKEGFIPTGGYLVTIDLYTGDINNPTKQRKARLPSETLEWVIKRVEQQGTTQDQLEGMDMASQSQIAGMLGGGSPQPSNQMAVA